MLAGRKRRLWRKSAIFYCSPNCSPNFIVNLNFTPLTNDSLFIFLLLDTKEILLTLVSENNIWRTQEVDNCQRVSGERRLRCCLVCNIHFHLSVATKTHGFYHEKPCRTQEVGFVCLLCPEAENSVLPPREIIIPSHKREQDREARVS
jgi:hypothetical protein